MHRDVSGLRRAIYALVEHQAAQVGLAASAADVLKRRILRALNFRANRKPGLNRCTVSALAYRRGPVQPDRGCGR